jgi:hypothetical protein
MPRKKSPTGKRTVNKSAFVRTQPTGMSARDVVAKGAAQGITLSEKYVYNIRAKAKAQGRIGAGPGRPGRKPGRPAGSRSAASGSAEERLVDLALELGLTKAEGLLSRLRSAIRNAVVG